MVMLPSGKFSSDKKVLNNRKIFGVSDIEAIRTGVGYLTLHTVIDYHEIEALERWVIVLISSNEQLLFKNIY